MESVDQEQEKAEQTVDEFVINHETGMLVSDGHEYADTARMRLLIRRANAIRKQLPVIQNDYVRLWRGNRPNEVGENPSFTNSLEGIALPFLDVYEGGLSYIDVPRTDLDSYVRTEAAAPNSEFILPAELAKNATAVEQISSLVNSHVRAK